MPVTDEMTLLNDALPEPSMMATSSSSVMFLPSRVPVADSRARCPGAASTTCASTVSLVSAAAPLVHCAWISGDRVDGCAAALATNASDSSAKMNSPPERRTSH
jgi:hypothetical protein